MNLIIVFEHERVVTVPRGIGGVVNVRIAPVVNIGPVISRRPARVRVARLRVVMNEVLVREL